MAKTILTKYDAFCIFCGKPCYSEHHLIFGVGMRKLAEEDGIKVPSCEQCHTSGKVTERVHDNSMAEKLSKIAGQLAFEKRKVAEGMSEDEAREAFRRRYGRSYL